MAVTVDSPKRRSLRLLTGGTPENDRGTAERVTRAAATDAPATSGPRTRLSAGKTRLEKATDGSQLRDRGEKETNNRTGGNIPHERPDGGPSTEKRGTLPHERPDGGPSTENRGNIPHERPDGAPSTEKRSNIPHERPDGAPSTEKRSNIPHERPDGAPSTEKRGNRGAAPHRAGTEPASGTPTGHERSLRSGRSRDTPENKDLRVPGEANKSVRGKRASDHKDGATEASPDGGRRAETQPDVEKSGDGCGISLRSRKSLEKHEVNERNASTKTNTTAQKEEESREGRGPGVTTGTEKPASKTEHTAAVQKDPERTNPSPDKRRTRRSLEVNEKKVPSESNAPAQKDKGSAEGKGPGLTTGGTEKPSYKEVSKTEHTAAVQKDPERTNASPDKRRTRRSLEVNEQKVSTASSKRNAQEESRTGVGVNEQRASSKTQKDEYAREGRTTGTDKLSHKVTSKTEHTAAVQKDPERTNTSPDKRRTRRSLEVNEQKEKSRTDVEVNEQRTSSKTQKEEYAREGRTTGTEKLSHKVTSAIQVHPAGTNASPDKGRRTRRSIEVNEQKVPSESDAPAQKDKGAAERKGLGLTTGGAEKPSHKEVSQTEHTTAIQKHSAGTNVSPDQSRRTRRSIDRKDKGALEGRGPGVTMVTEKPSHREDRKNDHTTVVQEDPRGTSGSPDKRRTRRSFEVNEQNVPSKSDAPTQKDKGSVEGRGAGLTTAADKPSHKEVSKNDHFTVVQEDPARTRGSPDNRRKTRRSCDVTEHKVLTVSSTRNASAQEDPLPLKDVETSVGVPGLTTGIEKRPQKGARENKHTTAVDPAGTSSSPDKSRRTRRSLEVGEQKVSVASSNQNVVEADVVADHGESRLTKGTDKSSNKEVGEKEDTTVVPEDPGGTRVSPNKRNKDLEVNVEGTKLNLSPKPNRDAAHTAIVEEGREEHKSPDKNIHKQICDDRGDDGIIANNGESANNILVDGVTEELEAKLLSKGKRKLDFAMGEGHGDPGGSPNKKGRPRRSSSTPVKNHTEVLANGDGSGGVKDNGKAGQSTEVMKRCQEDAVSMTTKEAGHFVEPNKQIGARPVSKPKGSEDNVSRSMEAHPAQSACTNASSTWVMRPEDQEEAGPSSSCDTRVSYTSETSRQKDRAHHQQSVPAKPRDSDDENRAGPSLASTSTLLDNAPSRDYKVHCCSKQVLQEVLKMCTGICEDLIHYQKFLSEEKKQQHCQKFVWDFETALQENVSINGLSWQDAPDQDAEPDIKILEDQLDEVMVEAASKRKRQPRKILGHYVKKLKAEREILKIYKPDVNPEVVTLDPAVEQHMKEISTRTASLCQQIHETKKTLPLQLKKAEGFSQVLRLQPALEGSQLRKDIFSCRVMMEDILKSTPKSLETTPDAITPRQLSTRALSHRKRNVASAERNLYPLRSKRKIRLES